MVARLARLDADISHLHFPFPPGEVANLLVGRARRTIITYHSDIVRQRAWRFLYRPLMRRVLARADRIIATSGRCLESSDTLRAHRDKCRIVPIGVDVARYAETPPLDRTSLKRRLHVPADAPMVLFVGVLRYYKGLEILLQAMQALPGATVLLVGEDSTARRTELEALAAALGVGGQVRFLGRQADEDLPALYHAADVFVLPAVERSEAFGAVQLEAMAAGRPVVSSDVGTGVAWVNQHEVTGLVVPPRRPDELAAALQRLLADPALRARLGAAGRERVLAHFSEARMLAEIDALYRRAL